MRSRRKWAPLGLEPAAFCIGGFLHYMKHESYLLSLEQQFIGRGLINSGIYGVLPKSLLHHVGDQALLTGIFIVSKHEFYYCDPTLAEELTIASCSLA